MARTAPAKVAAKQQATVTASIQRPDQSSVLAQAVILITLLVLAASSAQWALGPLFGQLLASHAVTYTIIGSIILVDLLRWISTRPRIEMLPIIPLFYTAVPFILDIATTMLGSTGGPRIMTITALCLAPAVVATTWSLRQILDSVKLLEQFPSRGLGASVVLAGVITTTTPLMHSLLLVVITAIRSTRPFVFPQILATVAALFAFRSSRQLALFSIVISSAFITRSVLGPSLDLVNLQLSSHPNSTSWSIIDRRYSTTGYISVLENSDAGYRLLRCDHSFLGGEWQTPAASKVGEPVYSVFTLLEAIRLIDRPEPASEKTSLIIGLGAGSAPKAMIAHGLETTIVEIDPIVHEYATKYFGLSDPHTSIIADAETWVKSQLTSTNTPRKPMTYDYIIHDVFTGGYEPLSLFTVEFLTDLRNLLTPGGAIAINYAGDTTGPLTRDILHTIRTVFGTTCRGFKDMDEPGSDGQEDGASGTFANMVIFCLPDGAGEAATKMDSMISNPSQRKPFYFRGTRESDFLNSESRREFLRPNAGLEIQFPPAPRIGAGETGGELAGSEDQKRGNKHEQAESAGRQEAGATKGETPKVLKKSIIAAYKGQQMESARRHWRIMRGAIPSRVWQVY